MGAFSRVQTHPEYSHQTQVYITLFAIFFKSFSFFFYWQNSTNNDPVLLFKLHLCFMFLYILRKLLMLAESRLGWALFAGTQNNHKPIWDVLATGVAVY